MNISQQVKRLRQRVNQLLITKSLPTLRMIMIKEDYMPMDLGEWDLAVKIEQTLLFNVSVCQTFKNEFPMDSKY